MPFLYSVDKHYLFFCLLNYWFWNQLDAHSVIFVLLLVFIQLFSSLDVFLSSFCFVHGKCVQKNAILVVISMSIFCMSILKNMMYPTTLIAMANIILFVSHMLPLYILFFGTIYENRLFNDSFIWVQHLYHALTDLAPVVKWSMVGFNWLQRIFVRHLYALSEIILLFSFFSCTILVNKIQLCQTDVQGVPSIPVQILQTICVCSVQLCMNSKFYDKNVHWINLHHFFYVDP